MKRRKWLLAAAGCLLLFILAGLVIQLRGESGSNFPEEDCAFGTHGEDVKVLLVEDMTTQQRTSLEAKFDDDPRVADFEYLSTKQENEETADIVDDVDPKLGDQMRDIDSKSGSYLLHLTEAAMAERSDLMGSLESIDGVREVLCAS